MDDRVVEVVHQQFKSGELIVSAFHDRVGRRRSDRMIVSIGTWAIGDDERTYLTKGPMAGKVDLSGMDHADFATRLMILEAAAARLADLLGIEVVHYSVEHINLTPRQAMLNL